MAEHLVNLKAALEYALELKGAEDCFADRCIVTLGSEVTRLEAENATMRAGLEEIRTSAHCLAKAGPLTTPTLDDAWGHFMHLSATAGQVLWSVRRVSS